MTAPAGKTHQDHLAEAFDGQAALFENAPVQTDPAALQRLVAFADLPADSLIFDAGCGPGLVSLALLQAGHRVVGVDLSAAMIDRARTRAAAFGDRAWFDRRAVDTADGGTTYDGSISRYVLHHVEDPAKFLRDQVQLIRPGGVLILSDHTTDPDPARAADHVTIEQLRDRTHTRNLTLASIIDLFTWVGLESIRAVEEPFTLDFDEWFDRGTPTASKREARDRIMTTPPNRGFRVEAAADGRLTIHCWRAIVRGVVPGQG